MTSVHPAFEANIIQPEHCEDCGDPVSERSGHLCPRCWSLIEKYGIDGREYNRMLAKQNHKCAICGRKANSGKRKLAVDHDHHTGKIRGLLCPQCNTMLGMAKDNEVTLLKAIHYLKRSRQ